MDQTALTSSRLAILRLTRVEGLGPVKLRRLLDAFGSPEAVLSAKPREIEEVDGVGARLSQAILNPKSEADALRDLETFTKAGVRLVFPDDEDFPPGLLEIADCPAILTVKGSILPKDKLAIAIVGSRRSSRYGLDQAERFAYALAARGVTVVSGLARGIDAAAHRGAMQAKGRTMAVLASGLGNIYPPEHEELAQQVQECGAVVSEAPLDGPPIAGLFPLRNRIISGMSLGILVVEAAERSGALSTANHAIDQNRDVFAIPGRLTDTASQGTNRLIQKGAMLVTKPEDILDALGPVEIRANRDGKANLPFPDDSMPTDLNEVEQTLWTAMGCEDTPLDILVDRTGLAASDASSALFLLELRKHVERLPGNAYRRAQR